METGTNITVSLTSPNIGNLVGQLRGLADAIENTTGTATPVKTTTRKARTSKKEEVEEEFELSDDDMDSTDTEESEEDNENDEEETEENDEEETEVKKVKPRTSLALAFAKFTKGDDDNIKKAKAILKKFGVKSVHDIKEKDIPSVLKMLK